VCFVSRQLASTSFRRQVLSTLLVQRWRVQAVTFGYLIYWLVLVPCVSHRSKGVPSGSGDFLRLLIGELGTPKLAPIFAYGKWLYPYRMQLHGASDLDQRCLKTRNSKDGCTFPPNVFACTSKIIPKPHFVGPFNAKPIIQIALRKSHVNGATKVTLYSYIGIGK